MNLKKVYPPLLVLMLLFSTVLPLTLITVNASPSPSTVSTSTDTFPTGYNHQLKIFYANNRHWVWYANGTHFGYKTSTDGTAWGSFVKVTNCTSGYNASVYFDDVYVHYVVANSTGAYYRRGLTQVGGTVSWSKQEQTVMTTNSSVPTVCVDSSGHAFVGLKVSDGLLYQPYVYVGGMTDGTWVTFSSYHLSVSSYSSWNTLVLALPSNEMYVLYGVYNGTVMYGRLYDGHNWGVQETVTTSVCLEPAAVPFGEDIFFCYLQNNTYNIFMTKRTYSSGTWSVEDFIMGDTSTNSVPTMSIDFPTNRLYTFFALNGYIYYKCYNIVSGLWSSLVQWIDETGTGIARQGTTSFLRDYGDMIGVGYALDTSPRTVRYDFLNFTNYDSKLQIIGGKYENTGDYSGIVTARIYDGSTFLFTTLVPQTQYYRYNGTLTQPIIKWSFGGSLLRTYTVGISSSITLYVPDSTYSAYTFYVHDPVGKTNSTTILETLIVIGGVEKTIEKVLVPTSHYVPVVLQTGRTYIREIVLIDGTLYRDTFSPSTASYTDTIVITSVVFNDKVQMSYKYLLVESTRPITTQIVVNYQDTLDQTTSLSVYVYFMNGTLWTSSVGLAVPAGLAVVTFNGANSTLEYKVVSVVVHTTFGTLTKVDYLSISPTFSAPFSLTFLGSQPWLTNVIPYMIVAASAGVFSALTVTGGMFVMIAVATLLYIINWLPLTSNILILGIAIVILFAIARRKESGWV